MVQWGFTLSSEEVGPAELIQLGHRAERSEMDFVSISDHFHPWIEAQGHSPFVWSTLGALAARTQQITLAVGVTCPITRMHPAVVAHAVATTAVLSGDRFVLGVGTGEALNEHILGDRWPRPQVRLSMLEEAIAIMRALWTGETVDHDGVHYEVENARLFDIPEAPIPVIVSAFGQQAAELAARVGDGYWGHTPDGSIVGRYRDAGGDGSMWSQIHVCVGSDTERCKDTVASQWPNAAIPGQLAQDLPTFTHFEQAASVLSRDQMTESIPCGNDIDAIVEQAETFVRAGYDHIYFHQIGPDQDAFFDIWTRELAERVRSIRAEAP